MRVYALLQSTLMASLSFDSGHEPGKCWFLILAICFTCLAEPMKRCRSPAQQAASVSMAQSHAAPPPGSLIPPVAPPLSPTSRNAVRDVTFSRY